jgi:hypothetical protein
MKLNNVSCEECGKDFDQRTFWQKFCSTRCRVRNTARINREDAARGRELRNQLAQTKVQNDLFA